MKKSIIAAAGGVLAAGFLTVSTPVAHAGPLCNPAFLTGAIYQQCLQAEQNQDQCGVARGCGGPGDMSGQCAEASRHTGIPCSNAFRLPADPEKGILK